MKLFDLKKIHFFATGSFRLPQKKEIGKLVEKIFSLENKDLNQLSFIFCSDEELLELNKKHLDHDFYTDILTFDLSENEDSIISEVYISTDRVRENAKHLKIPFLHELTRVIIHGALHLCGYRDKKKSEISIMRQKEDHYLRLSGNSV